MNNMGEDNRELKLDNNNKLSIKSTNNVVIKSSITIVGSNITLPVEIIADFSNIPNYLHYEYYQALIYQYNEDIKIYNNVDKESTKCNGVKPWYKRLFN
jgi:hypothetical protein